MGFTRVHLVLRGLYEMPRKRKKTARCSSFSHYGITTTSSPSNIAAVSAQIILHSSGKWIVRRLFCATHSKLEKQRVYFDQNKKLISMKELSIMKQEGQLYV